MTSFERIFHESKIILTEGALVERLKKEFGLKMDDWINHAGLIYSDPEKLELVYRQYINIGREYKLPIMIMTPTRKVNCESLEKSIYKDKNILSDSCRFLNKIRDSYPEYSQNILIGGLVGCKGDAYSGEKVLDINESYRFHRQQAMMLRDEQIDFLFAGIMPEINEAIGMSMALSETKLPYIISFMIQKDGRLMDGTMLSDAIEKIDEVVSRKPICFMTNCIHPTNLIEALSNNSNAKALARFCGIQANASILSPLELNNSKVLLQNDFTHIVDEMKYLYVNYNFKILGGCCGTNEEFIDLLSQKIAKEILNN